jgi:hypothetical protein
MINKILKTVRGFTPVELVIMVSFAALSAGALIYLATTPHYTASTQPVNVNIKLDSATASSTPSAKAQSTCGTNVVANSLGGYDVTPVGFPADVTNVQCAIDNSAGGTVVLKAGTFDFGDKATLEATKPNRIGTVFVTNDVDIKGEKDASGNLLTTVKNGYRSFSIGLQPRDWHYHYWYDELVFANYLTGVVPVQTTIKDIMFDSYLYSGVFITGSIGFELSGCEFRNAVNVSGSGGISKSIVVGPLQSRRKVEKENISGTVLIDNNNIYGTPDQTLGFDAFFIDADFLVKNNIFKGGNFGMRFFSVHGNVEIANNDLETKEPIAVNEYGYRGEGDPSVMTTYIHDNKVKGTFNNIDLTRTTNAVVQNNDLTVSNCQYGIGMRGGSNAYVANNKISGTIDPVDGLGAVATKTYRGQGASNSTFVGNNLDIENLDASVTFYLNEDTQNNVVRGYTGACSVINLGTNNSITGCGSQSGSGGIGDTVSEGVAIANCFDAGDWWDEVNKTCIDLPSQ